MQWIITFACSKLFRIDSITHIVLGGCIGEAIAGRKLGKKAIIYGAIAQSIPDIDVVSSSWLNTADDLLAHRGITHSILFAVLASVVLGVVMQKVHRKSAMTQLQWIIFLLIEMFTHITLDAF